MGDYNFIGNGINHNIEAAADFSFIGNGNNNHLGDGVNQLSYSAILAGKDNTIEGTVSNSAIIAGENNTITHSNTFILGSNISSTQTGTTYVENLNIGNVGNGTPLINLGLDSNGNVVTGTTGGGGGSTTSITGYSYNPASNTFTIGLSGGTSFDSQILEMSGITVNGDIIQTGTTSTFSNGNYVEIGTGFANTGQLTFNANHDGGVGTNTYTPVFAGNASAGMTVIKMPSGGEGGLDFYVKNHGVTSGSQNLNTFTKILELNQDGNSTFGGELDILSGLTLSQTPTLNNSETAILVRNNSTGEVEYREASTLTGSTDTNTFVTGGTLSTDSLLTLGYNNGSFATPIDLSTFNGWW